MGFQTSGILEVTLTWLI